MHIPDGFIDGPTSAAMGAVAVVGVGVCAKKARDALDDRQAPLAGLTAAFIFAVQMLNFPVAGGTSGHLLGGVLAAVLVGPWVAVLCMTVVLGVQALFADGGLSALGLNITTMGIVTAFAGYALFVVLRKVLPKTKSSVAVASGVAAGISVPLSALFFTLEYAVGGVGDASVGTVAAAMVGVHVLIGIGEGVITGLTVSAVLSARPDLVQGAQDLTEPPGVPRGAPVAAGGTT
jgi:cobalt/nickel transport system permease protein